MLLASLLDALLVHVLPACCRPWLAKAATFLFAVRLAALERDRIGDVIAADTARPSRTLLIAFAGGALQIGGESRPEFVRSTAALGVDRVFLTDPSNAWYTDALYDAALPALAAPYERVVLLGNCMGATGALRFAHLAHAAVLVNPHVLPHRHRDWLVRFAAARLALDAVAFLGRVHDSARRCATITVFRDAHSADQVALLAPAIPTVTVVPCDDVPRHLPRHLRDTGQLFQALSSACKF